MYASRSWLSEVMLFCIYMLLIPSGAEAFPMLWNLLLQMKLTIAKFSLQLLLAVFQNITNRHIRIKYRDKRVLRKGDSKMQEQQCTILWTVKWYVFSIAFP